MTSTSDDGRPVPPVTDRATWQARIDELRAKEKAHTRAGDALAAERRRLPMVAVDAQTPLIGPNGPVPLLDVFEGRSPPTSTCGTRAGTQPVSARAAPSRRRTSRSSPTCTRAT